MVQLYDVATNDPIGQITEDQLQFLVNQLEEESTEDQDYYINQDELDSFAARGADPELLAVLRSALNGREDMDIRWDRR